MGDIGVPELIMILAIVLVIFGPSKVPEIGKAMGKAIHDFRSAMQEPTPDKPEHKDA